MPLKRHPALQPLSREHHQALLLGQYLRADVPDYEGYPTDLEERIAYTRRQFTEQILPHFEREEQVLIPSVRGHDSDLDALCDIIMAEHRALHEGIDEIASANTGEARALLDAWGRLLIAHIRREERQWFTEIQEKVPEQVLQRLAL